MPFVSDGYKINRMFYYEFECSIYLHIAYYDIGHIDVFDLT